MAEVVAPSLSTYQDEVTFEKFEEAEHLRPYLGPDWENQNGLIGKLREYYSIAELLSYLTGTSKYSKITLQFPDSLVADSAIVVQLLQDGLGIKPGEQIKEKECKKTCEGCECKTDAFHPGGVGEAKKQVWILADTAYSACCIDEVAAGHVGSDIVLHFGDACLNAVQKLDSIYVFGKPFLDSQTVADKFRQTYDAEDKVILMADAPYTRHLPQIHQLLKNEFKSIGYADIELEKCNLSKIVGFKSSTDQSMLRFSNRVIKGIVLDEADLADYKLFHITTPEPPHLLYLSTKFSSLTIYEPMNNTTNSGPFPSMMKRYRYMHVARTAGTVGILVNTLSLKNTTQMIKMVTSKIRDAGKKHYMFVVGKPNVAKLANFESIDVWCILGCGQGGIILDQTNEFFKPIITPYELDMALNPMVTWTGQWVTDFEKMLEEESDAGTNSEEESPKSQTLEGEDEAPEFDSVTGRYVSTSRPLRQIQHLEIDAVPNVNSDGQLVKAFSKTVAIKGTVSTSATYLQNREWTGLGSDFTSDVDEEGALVEDGRGGVARGYDFDMGRG